MSKQSTSSTMCPGPGCKEPAGSFGKFGCCSKRCQGNYNAAQYRRRHGQSNIKDTIAALEPRICKLDECGIEFQPTALKQEYCSVKCRNRAGRIAKLLNQKETPREHVQRVLVEITRGERNQAYAEFLEWQNKFEAYPTDDRHKETHDIIIAAKDYLEQEGKMSMRHMYYHLAQTRPDLVPENSKRQYQRIVHILTEARLRPSPPDDLAILMDAFVDNVRDSITYPFDDDLLAYRRKHARWYDVDMWKNQDSVVEIVVEKDSVVSIVERTVRSWNTPLRVLRGSSGWSYLNNIANDLSKETRHIYFYYAGDHDPDGHGLETSAQERLLLLLMEEYDWSPQRIAEQISWKRIGFLPEDFDHDEFSVDSLEAKETSSYYEVFKRKFGVDARAAELEAIPPHELRRRVEAAILTHLDTERWNERKKYQEDCRDFLERYAEFPPKARTELNRLIEQ